jgi:DNA modification methylase
MGKGKTAAPSAFRSRIVGEGEEAPDQLLANPLNWRVHPKEQQDALEGLLKQVGWVQRVIVNKRTGHVVDGHARVALALRRNEPTLPVLYVDLSEDEERLVLAAIDPIGGMAGRDDDMLAQVLDGLTAEDAGLQALLDSLKPEVVEATEGLTDPDDAPEVQADPMTKPGDVWLCGKHRLMCGDSTNIQALEALTGGGVDMWLTDPPYNVAVQGGNHGDPERTNGLRIKNDQMPDADFRQFLRDAYVAADAVMKPGAVFYIWHADSEGFNFRGAALDAGWRVRQCLIWKKSSIVMGRQDYHWKHEPCLYGWKEGAGHLWAADRKQTTILEFDRPSRNGEHPTMKPVALFEYQMLNNTKGGDKVLDSFGGSGTTMIAAEKNGRHACLMELDPRYCDVIVRRWQAFTGKAATLEGDGRTFDEIAAERVPAEA